MAESANKTNALTKHVPLSLTSLAKLLDEMAQYHKTEVNEATVKVWYEDLSHYSETAIRNAWIEHRRLSSYFPFVSDLKKFLDFQPETPKEFHSEPSPCACSKEELIALDGEFCEHGYAHGPARAAKILSQKSAAIKSMTEADEEARRTELRAQAERVSK